MRVLTLEELNAALRGGHRVEVEVQERTATG